MLAVHDLVSYYGRYLALGGVSFEADTGFCLLTGPNGAGKTTLLRVLAGVHGAVQGEARMDDVDLLANRDVARRMMSYLPDSVALYSDLTVSEHLTYRAQLKGFAGRRLRARLRHVFEVFDLRSIANVRTRSLAAGQRRLVGLADAFLSESRILLLDDPFSDLDDIHARTLCTALASVAHHAIVLVAARSFEPFPGIEGKCLVLSSGSIVGEIPLSGENLAPLQTRVAKILYPSSMEEA